jgi:ankyrin repeat protein
MLLAAGADVNEADDLDDTALHVAAERNDDDEIVKLLLEAGADINAQRLFDETPLDVAEYNGKSKIAAILRDAAERST